MDINQFSIDSSDIFFEKLNRDFFVRRITEANFSIAIGGSTHRAFSHISKNSGAPTMALADGANELKLYLDKFGKSISSRTDFLMHHKIMFELFKTTLLKADVSAKSEGTYLKAMNIVIWHYVLGEKGVTPPAHLSHLKEYIHPSFDGDVLRGLKATLQKKYPRTAPKISGWSKSGSRSGIIKSYEQYLSLVEWVEKYLPVGVSLISVDNFWRMNGCKKP